MPKHEKYKKKEYTIIIIITIDPMQHTPISIIKKNTRRKTSISKKKISTYTSQKTSTPPKRKILSYTFHNKK
jgi:hypothetical protein